MFTGHIGCCSTVSVILIVLRKCRLCSVFSIVLEFNGFKFSAGLNRHFWCGFSALLRCFSRLSSWPTWLHERGRGFVIYGRVWRLGAHKPSATGLTSQPRRSDPVLWNDNDPQWLVVHRTTDWWKQWTPPDRRAPGGSTDSQPWVIFWNWETAERWCYRVSWMLPPVAAPDSRHNVA